MEILELEQKTFDHEVMESKEMVLVDFMADWCGYCKVIMPVLRELAEDQANGLKVCLVNIDDEPELAERFDVLTLPALFVIKDGQILETSIGITDRAGIFAMLETARDKAE